MSKDTSHDQNGSNIVEILLDNAYQDTQVLITNEHEGDHFSIDRDVEFIFRVGDRKKANTVRSFIDDNRYGNAVVEKDGKRGYRISVTAHMPLRQNVLCSVSALMACLAYIFDIEYDGWSSELKRGGEPVTRKGKKKGERGGAAH